MLKKTGRLQNTVGEISKHIVTSSKQVAAFTNHHNHTDAGSCALSQTTHRRLSLMI